MVRGMVESSSEVPIAFDRKAEGICIVFHPCRPQPTDDGSLLWWAFPPTPESICEVARFIGHRRLPVTAIVIGGLDDYPILESRWPKWLARLSAVPGPQMIVVDTGSLSARQRRKLISGTRRQCNLTHRSDPISAAWSAVSNWIKRIA